MNTVKRFCLAAVLAVAFASAASAQDYYIDGGGHYSGPLDVDIHSPMRVGDGTGHVMTLNDYHYAPPTHYAPPPPPPRVHHYDPVPTMLPPPPSRHMDSTQYRHYLEQTVPNYQDLPLGARLRHEWNATGGWDNPRNMEPTHKRRRHR